MLRAIMQMRTLGRENEHESDDKSLGQVMQMAVNWNRTHHATSPRPRTAPRVSPTPCWPQPSRAAVACCRRVLPSSQSPSTHGTCPQHSQHTRHGQSCCTGPEILAEQLKKLRADANGESKAYVSALQRALELKRASRRNPKRFASRVTGNGRSNLAGEEIVNMLIRFNTDVPWRNLHMGHLYAVSLNDRDANYLIGHAALSRGVDRTAKLLGHDVSAVEQHRIYREVVNALRMGHHSSAL